MIAGPASALVRRRDVAEPYNWTPGDDYENGAVSYAAEADGAAAGLAQWVADFRTAWQADNDLRATLVLSNA